MSDKDTDKFMQALINLNVKEYKFEGDEPTNEAEFKAGFKKVTGADDSGGAIYTDDPSKFGVTWSQIKAEMDKL
tara:strand:+ start:1661 stop:1882 length:222 start_codon:yes stop_codon:yes gene_type:complete